MQFWIDCGNILRSVFKWLFQQFNVALPLSWRSYCRQVLKWLIAVQIFYLHVSEFNQVKKNRDLTFMLPKLSPRCPSLRLPWWFSQFSPWCWPSFLLVSLLLWKQYIFCICSWTPNIIVKISGETLYVFHSLLSTDTSWLGNPTNTRRLNWDSTVDTVHGWVKLFEEPWDKNVLLGLSWFPHCALNMGVSSPTCFSMCSIWVV